MPEKESNLIVDLSFSFALKIVKYAGKLESDRNYVIAKQVLRSGTSIGANIKKLRMPKAGQTLFTK